jgi:hypothetical protein
VWGRTALKAWCNICDDERRGRKKIRLNSKDYLKDARGSGNKFEM